MERNLSESFVKKVYVIETEGPWRRERSVVRWKDRVKEYMHERLVVAQWSSTLICEPRVPGSNPRYTLTTFHSLISLPSGQRLPKLLPYCPQMRLTTFICI